MIAGWVLILVGVGFAALCVRCLWMAAHSSDWQHANLNMTDAYLAAFAALITFGAVSYFYTEQAKEFGISLAFTAVLVGAIAGWLRDNLRLLDAACPNKQHGCD